MCRDNYGRHSEAIAEHFGCSVVHRILAEVLPTTNHVIPENYRFLLDDTLQKHSLKVAIPITVQASQA